MLLHGTGADEHDLLPLGERLQAALPRLALLSLRGPVRAAWGGYAWFEGFSSAPSEQALRITVPSSVKSVLSCLESAPSAFGTDAASTFLLGFSQGATIGWSLNAVAWQSPELLCQSYLLSGRLFEQHADAATPLGSLVARQEELRGRRLWATHGSLDEVTPVALAHSSLETARALSLPVAFSVHGGGHEIPETVLQSIAGQLATSMQ